MPVSEDFEGCCAIEIISQFSYIDEEYGRFYRKTSIKSLKIELKEKVERGIRDGVGLFLVALNKQQVKQYEKTLLKLGFEIVVPSFRNYVHKDSFITLYGYVVEKNKVEKKTEKVF